MANLIGTKPNQVPTNGSLGTMAFQDSDSVKVDSFESTGIQDNATSTKVTIDDTGVDVTGTVTADGLTVDGDAEISGTASRLYFTETDTTDKNTRLVSSGGDFFIQTSSDDKGTNTPRFSIDHATGNVSFYEDTGTTAKMVWSSSAEKLSIDGVGTGLNVTGPTQSVAGGNSQIKIGSTDTASSDKGGQLNFTANTVSLANYPVAGVHGYHETVGAGNYSGYLSMYTTSSGGGLTERMRIDSSGNVGIGETNPTGFKLHVKSAGSDALRLFNSSGSGNTIAFIDQSWQSQIQGSEGRLLFKTGGSSERARIDSSGNLLVGKTSADSSASNGFQVSQNGFTYITRTSGTANVNTVITLDRKTTDGSIAEFRKDGATVGSIGTSSGNLYIEDNDAGLRFSSASNEISPCGNNGANRDAGLNLGATNNRFKDLYLSGGVITPSDYRLKEDIQPMQSYADTVKQMNLVNFAWKESGEREDGFIAHELQALVPNAVRGNKDAVNENGEAQYQGVDPLKLIPVLTKALQEALERIETLENN